MIPAAYLRAIGQILAVSYPLLALSAGARAIVQLWFRPNILDKFPPALSGIAALVYLFATTAFLIRKPWAWWVSVVLLTLETIGVLIVGFSSVFHPIIVGHTVWQYFGRDYAFLPLIQPILGLFWLFDKNIRTTFFKD